MTLHILADLIQGTDEWHDQRRGIVTASVVGRLITASTIKVAKNIESRALTAQLAAERITGYTEPTYTSDDMAWGHTIEPIVAEIYSEHYAPVEHVGFMVEDRWGFPIGLSPDGLVGADGLIETKSRNQKEQLLTVLADEVPAKHMAQCQAALLVSGRKWLDYISYSSGMALWHKRVEPDPVWFEAIVAAVTEFEKAAEQMARTYLNAVKGLPLTERITNDLGLVF